MLRLSSLLFVWFLICALIKVLYFESAGQFLNSNNSFSINPLDKACSHVLIFPSFFIFYCPATEKEYVYL